MKLIGEDDLRARVAEDEALAAVEKAFRALTGGAVVQPPPFGMDLEEVRGEVHVKGAYLRGEPIFAIKVASGFYANAEKGLPTGSGLVLVFCSSTGAPLGLLQDNGYLTELRTGAAGALAVRLLTPARPLVAAVLGAGSQARYQIRAIGRIRELSEVRVWSPDPREIEPYLNEISPSLPGSVLGTFSVEEAVRGADVVVTVTPARRPILELPWLGEGVTIVAVGSDGPEKQELSTEILRSAGKVVVDSKAQCVRLGETHHAISDGVMSADEIHAELGEVLAGARPGREADELIVCDLTGVGAQDAAMAGAAWSLLGGSSA